MKKIKEKICQWRSIAIFCLILTQCSLSAQTDLDAIMMSKNNFCTGLMYQHGSWNNYWEGTLKRDNQNLGTVSNNMYAVMGNYGISGKLNLLFGLPYVNTKASAGTLHSMNGLQDLPLWVKWMPFEKRVGPGTLSLYGIGGLSIPVSNYIADYLPLSIGLKSTNFSLRGMVDYQIGSIFATLSGTYVVRNNVTIDRSSYYTDQLILSNEVEMPNVATINFRFGYRSSLGIAELVLNQSNTLGGFDITRNNMPFPSNQMNATTAGLAFKYNVSAVEGLSLIGGTNFTIAGRNVGQTNSFNGGLFYILDFSKKEKTSSSDKSTTN
ncbi:MAG: hypothetical protein B7Y15_07150 [Bacteroidetes bacterium 24-39-8]|jgi:hypothetical protein|nr:MAG: hypothetical protein B7Y69_07970 [Sphingobacteriia bacterium 35-40-8]OYZ51073.1 MAG: hypothetical protein B7Y15_07150 [Bacteroidetes bacterium 24-39-8]OZA69474.1 MAG: hypothetical protein B7X72_00315 [Sphingobacteriia bacterium 39-39-8]HQR92943.1 hypothetical protein [Sediminibacterium sp.]HQS55131.1 hypothetical protein [Sediminibacterium sp.]